MRNFIFCLIFVLFLLTSCVDVEKKYADYKINNEVQHFGAKRVELKEGVYIYEYDGKASYSDFGLKGQYENEEELTFVVWIKPTEFRDAPVIDNGSNLVWLRNDGRFQYEFKYKKMKDAITESLKVVTNSKVILNEWNFITAVYKKSNYIKIYLNGKLESIIDGIEYSYGENYGFTSYFVSKTAHFNQLPKYKGFIDTDNIYIYNKSLSDRDIKSFYNKTKDKYVF